MRKGIDVLLVGPIKTGKILFDYHPQPFLLRHRLAAFNADFVGRGPSSDRFPRNLDKNAIGREMALRGGDISGGLQVNMECIPSAFAKNDFLFQPTRPCELFDFTSFQAQSNGIKTATVIS